MSSMVQNSVFGFFPGGGGGEGGTGQDGFQIKQIDEPTENGTDGGVNETVRETAERRRFFRTKEQRAVDGLK